MIFSVNRRWSSISRVRAATSDSSRCAYSASRNAGASRSATAETKIASSPESSRPGRTVSAPSSWRPASSRAATKPSSACSLPGRVVRRLPRRSSGPARPTRRGGGRPAHGAKGWPECRRVALRPRTARPVRPRQPNRRWRLRSRSRRARSGFVERESIVGAWRAAHGSARPEPTNSESEKTETKRTQRRSGLGRRGQDDRTHRLDARRRAAQRAADAHQNGP